RMAAQRADAEDLARLEGLAREASDPALPPADVLRLDFEFYVALTQASKNRAFSLLINTVRQAVLSFAPFFAHVHASTDVARRHHRALIRAIAKHNLARGPKIADTYLARGAELLLSRAS